MKLENLTPIQQAILKALEDLGEKARYSEAILAKKIRENNKLEGKKKAGIGLADLEKAISFLEENKQIHYSLMMNSANDLLIEKTETARPLELEVRQRRQKSEKSMEIFTNSDLAQKKGQGGKGKQKPRTQRKSININSNFEDFDE